MGPVRIRPIRLAVGIVILGVAAWWIAPMTPLGVPAVVRDRPPLPSCGEETGNLRTGSQNPSARRCFWEAYQAGRPAELISTRPTIEGDPITSIWRLLPNGLVEVFVDQRRDAWSKGGWYRLECVGLGLNGSGMGWDPDFLCGAAGTPLS